MNVIVSSRERLRARYGSAGLAAVEQALEELVAARSAAGIASLRYMIEEGVPQFGIDGALIEWQAIAAQLGKIAEACISAGDRLASVLIIGGPQVVPFGVLPNPLEDRDQSLAVDCVYGTLPTAVPLTTDEENIAANAYGIDWPVGRLPDAEEPQPTLLVGSIRAAAAQHRRGTLPLVPALCYSTASWRAASESICAEINTLAPSGGRLELIVSPPTTADRLDRRAFERARLIYCNLHGVVDAPIWYGQEAGDILSMLPALRPLDLATLDLTGAVLLSAACYGAAVTGGSPANSMALMALSRNVAAFIGATVITYGPLQPPSSEADLLLLHILRMIYGQVDTIGEAFLAGRIGMLREVLMARGYLDEDDAKTLLGFVLYGDPTLRIAYHQGSDPTTGRSV